MACGCGRSPDGCRGWHALTEEEYQLEYKSFLNEKEGTLIGYCEVDDFAAAKAKMSTLDVNTRWQEFMQPLFPQDKRADESFENFVEVFHLA